MKTISTTNWDSVVNRSPHWYSHDPASGVRNALNADNAKQHADCSSEYAYAQEQLQPSDIFDLHFRSWAHRFPI